MERPTAHLGLHHVALHVADVARARHFYVELLGFAVEWQPDEDNLYLCSGSDNLALHRAKAPPQGAQRLDHLGIVVRSAGDVADWETFLLKAGVKVLAATRTHRDGATSCYVADPDGTAVQIIHHPPIAPRLAAVNGQAI